MVSKTATTPNERTGIEEEEPTSTLGNLSSLSGGIDPIRQCTRSISWVPESASSPSISWDERYLTDLCIGFKVVEQVYIHGDVVSSTSNRFKPSFTYNLPSSASIISPGGASGSEYSGSVNASGFAKTACFLGSSLPLASCAVIFKERRAVDSEAFARGYWNVGGWDVDMFPRTFPALLVRGCWRSIVSIP